MNVEQIVALLVQERDRLERAIQALGGGAKRRGRPPGKAEALAGGGWSGNGHAPKKRKGFSVATRRKMALAQKKRWAALKAAK